MTERKAIIYSPYWQTLGGGEVYALSFGLALTRFNYQVKLAIQPNQKEAIIQAGKRFNLDISQLNLDASSSQSLSQLGLWHKLTYLQKFDLVFWVSDGSLPWLFARRHNLVHFQVPFTQMPNDLSTRIKIHNHQYICNSDFTANIIANQLGDKCRVLYPPVNLVSGNSTKENIILSVGRFSQKLNNKRQDVLVDAFIKMHQAGITDWRLVLVGGTDADSQPILDKLTAQSQGYPVEIKPDLDYQSLQELYLKSKLYWHAAGFGIDQEVNPELVEHFGISVVEAMSAGAVPLVVSNGGPSQIVEADKTGFHYHNIDQLVNKSMLLISDQHHLNRLAANSRKRAQDFSQEKFELQVKAIIDG